MARIASERVTVAGQTESGKTEFLLRHFLSSGRVPRLLIVDRTGEWFKREPMAPSAIGLADTVRVLDDLARRPRWRVITSLSNEEIETLGGALVGIPDVTKGYAYNVGGMGLMLSEVELLVPITGAPEELRSLWRRGSHAGLSIYADAQRVSNLSKEVTSQCRWLAFLALYEPADLDYLRKQLGSIMAPKVVQWIQRTQYAAALFDQRRRVCHLVKPNGAIAESLTDGPSVQYDAKQSDSTADR
jgi:hypothetical protein